MNCKFCSNPLTFKQIKKGNQFCSRRCSGSKLKSTKVCPNCLVQFFTTPGDKKRFCSSSCAQSFNQQGKKKSEACKLAISRGVLARLGKQDKQERSSKSYDLICVFCGCKFSSKIKKTKLCSKNCLLKFKSQKSKYNAEKRKQEGTWMRGGLRLHSSRGNSGWYDGIFFNSTYELAFYILCKAQNKSFKRCSDTFEYMHPSGKVRIFHPDFIVDGKLVEIKGLNSEESRAKEAATKGEVQFIHKPEFLSEISPLVEKITGLKLKDLPSLYWRSQGESNPSIRIDSAAPYR